MFAEAHIALKKSIGRGDRLDRVEDIVRRFGINPRLVGVRHKNWRIVPQNMNSEEYAVGAMPGYLCISTDDKLHGQLCGLATLQTNFIGFSNNMFETSELNYYFRPLENGL